MHPLTHHEIMALIEPFTRRGQRVDLAATDRIARRLVFKPIEHAGSDDDHAATPLLREALTLENSEPGRWRLTRRVSLGDGPQASLEVDGAQPGEVLARLDAIAPEQQCRAGGGFSIAWQQRLLPQNGNGDEASRLLLTGATVQLDGLVMNLTLSSVRGIPADVALNPAADGCALPEDLLAVLGLAWSPLRRSGPGWVGSLRLRGGELRRSRDAQARLLAAAAHLARTLAEPPSRFHQRFARARWMVVLRRAVPLIVCVAVVAAAACVPLLQLTENSPLRMLIFNAPPLLLVLFLCLKEIPRFEIPPWPRPSSEPGWCLPAASAGPG